MLWSSVFTNPISSLTFSVSPEELRAHPFTDVTLSCHFSFVEGTENLEFSWEREDITEEYEFHNNTEQLEDQNSLYEGRVSVDRTEISEGSLSLLLRNVDFMDEAIYKCSAITPDGRGESTIKLIVEDSEMPQVRFDKIDDEDVATCVSKGWYLTPNVTWMDRAERDLSNHSTVEVLEEQINGFYRVFSVLRYPVKLNEKYVCQITETDVNNQPFRVIRKYPKRKYPQGYDFYLEI
ncbi:butyrophilin-like protein 10 isoform X3 [Marmota monax]|uniref:butyrophilin-like protein 10 isoform X3 n=1 Tax=Marmota monax TaxID=9995 RepID=UPI0026EB0782|nr:butyrophilin-like protein 10 isoform X3 [Marmota monax]